MVSLIRRAFDGSSETRCFNAARVFPQSTYALSDAMVVGWTCEIAGSISAEHSGPLVASLATAKVVGPGIKFSGLDRPSTRERND